MEIQEFSSEFDILYNNISSNQAPGLDEYEKSVFLTKAQSEILKNHFNPKGNKYNEGFDDTEKRQIDFSSLIKVVIPIEYTEASYIKFDDRSKVFMMPTDILFILNETVNSTIKEVINSIPIVPISYDEYSRLNSRPFKQPLKYQGWRLIQSVGDIGFISEVIIANNAVLSSYKVRYVRRPKPIILTDLRDNYPGITIEGVSTVSNCELDPILHQEVLQRAVELARITYAGNTQGIVELGQRSE